MPMNEQTKNAITATGFFVCVVGVAFALYLGFQSRDQVVIHRQDSIVACVKAGGPPEACAAALVEPAADKKAK